MDPEEAHELVAAGARFSQLVPFADAILRGTFEFNNPRLHVRVCGIDFKNPIGMGAGFDKTGELYPFLSNMGFGHVECGTFTRHGQPGNPKPRLFRFPEQAALINRMGFNNPGADHAAGCFAKQRHGAIRGINLGKSKVTELNDARDDYLYSLAKLSVFADYIAINVSSPNTPGLRQLQEKDRLADLLGAVRAQCRVPLFLKLAPDLTESALDDALGAAEGKCDGFIICNTTIDKSSVGSDLEGGLSGAPLARRSLEMLRITRKKVGSKVALISVGGIGSAEEALLRIRAGASLIQIYTAYIYGGPFLPATILRGINDFCSRENTTVNDLIGVDAK
ncbi:MAG: quinone-dependent dihydroorotate dehydrogenase [Leptospirales bacterium]|nr:quinone-dependent dihydroorotate dehydrogenase [Leptospirales bacterium]